MMSVSECCRLDRRRRAIIEAARTLFVERGYENATLGDIVERAGGSLATVYKLFGNKDGLLEAAVFEHASSGDEIVREAMEAGGDRAAILHRIAGAFDAHFLDAETVALVRIVIARSMSDREFARRFDLATPVGGEGPPAIVAAQAAAIARLSEEIVTALR